MKPKNKFQRQIVETSQKLPSVTPEQIRWGYRNCIEHIGHRNAKGVITCTDCGHTWQASDAPARCKCPQCKVKLKVETTRKRVFKDCAYFTVITACEGYQVLWHFMIKCTAKVGQMPRYFHSEVMQRWIAPSGKYCTFAQLRQTMGTMYYDSWIFATPLELRQELGVYDRIGTGEIYPRKKLIPELKRTGYQKGTYGQKLKDLFCILLTDRKAETLLKAEQTALLHLFMDDKSRNREYYWPSIRICIRNGYKVKEASIWCDYIDSLRFLGKDLHNAKYVCPADLLAEHDKAMHKVVKIEIAKEAEGNTPDFLSKEWKYKIAKAKFFGLMFSDGRIIVRVLESVQEIVTEGKAMHHCVGGYHSKEDSLILSATIDGKRVETVEVSLSQLKVIQCRGVCNKTTEHHSKIVSLVNDNMPFIQKRIVA